MPLVEFYRVVRDYARDSNNAYTANTQKLTRRFGEVFARTWDLGFTAFGGPPVHFQILHQRFVEGRGGKTPWIDEQAFQELFAVCQALPGPGSTKMLFCITLIHAGILPAIFVFLLWSLPGAIGMYALSLGVQRIQSGLPVEAYALLTGLNAATVGIIALAAVQLAEKGIRDKLTRLLIIIGASAGMCYTALWFFPVLMVSGGIATVVWDLLLRGYLGRFWAKMRRYRDRSAQPSNEEGGPAEFSTESQSAPHQMVELSSNQSHSQQKPAVQRRQVQTASSEVTANAVSSTAADESPTVISSEHQETDTKTYSIPIKIGITVMIVFFGSFIALLVTRGTLAAPPRPLDLFTNMYLAGTIIFGGGPVVIPLLREYVVQPGWVTSRDFLLGLAIIQAFPGPNFNFAVYLGALAMRNTQYSQISIFGALLGYLGIFPPGLILSVAFQSLWRKLRKNVVVVSALRGVNATAIGLVFTAVYRLWQIGSLTAEDSDGRPLASDPWWVVVSVVAYSGAAWFNVPAPLVILAGGVLGLCWFAVVG